MLLKILVITVVRKWYASNALKFNQNSNFLLTKGSLQYLDSGLDWTVDWTLDWTMDWFLIQDTPHLNNIYDKCLMRSFHGADAYDDSD